MTQVLPAQPDIEPADSAAEDVCRPAAAPLAAAAASYVGVVLAVLLGALGVVCLRDVAIKATLLDGTPWIPLAIKAFDGLRPSPVILVIGVVIGIMGLALCVLALLPRRATAVPVHNVAGGAVYVPLRDVARIASAAAQTVSGVAQATSSASRRTVSVRCTTSRADRGELSRLVTEAVRDELQPLVHQPRIVVRIRQEARL